MEQLALPPDTWVGKDADVQRVELKMPPGIPAGTTLPFAHVAKARSSRGGLDGFYAPSLGASGPALSKQPFSCDCGWTWWTGCPSQAPPTSLLWSAIDDGSPCFAHCCNATDRPRPLSLQTRFTNRSTTRVSEVAAMSSAAAGLTSSPTIAKEAIKSMLSSIGLKTRDALLIALAEESGVPAAEADARLLDDLGRHVDDFVDACMPFGLQTLGVGLDLEREDPTPLPLEEERAWSPDLYRGIDGVYSDNTALLMTLATMIHDCERDAAIDCRSKTLDLVLINDGDSSEPATNKLGHFFSDFGSPVGSFEQTAWYSSVPSRWVFAEEYPPPEAWTRYFTPGAAQFEAFDPSEVPSDIISGIANGRLSEEVAVLAEASAAAMTADVTTGAHEMLGSAANTFAALRPSELQKATRRSKQARREIV